MSEEDQGVASLSKLLEGALEKESDDPLANGVLNEMSDSRFMDSLSRPSTAVIEFYTATCPYCKQLAPILDELASDYRSKVYFGKVNIDKIEAAVESFEVVGVPLVIAFKKGHPVAKMEGLRSRDEIDDWVDSIHKGFRPMNLESGAVTRITLSDLAGGSRGSI
jgi:thioredoxin 1